MKTFYKLSLILSTAVFSAGIMAANEMMPQSPAQSTSSLDTNQSPKVSPQPPASSMMKERMENMTPEQKKALQEAREKARQKWEQMTPEQKEAFHKQVEQKMQGMQPTTQSQ